MVLVLSSATPGDTHFYKRWEVFGKVLKSPDARFNKDVTILVTNHSWVITDRIIEAYPNLTYICSANTNISHIKTINKSIKIVYLDDPRELTEVTSVSEMVFRYIMIVYKERFLPPRRLSQKTIGIVGLGRIGKHVAEIAEGYKMKIKVHDEFDSIENLRSLMKNSDIVSIHLKETLQTKGMINNELISLMKMDSLLINTSRPSIVDHEFASMQANRGMIYFAHDFQEKHSFFSPPRIITTAHIAGNTIEDRIYTDTLIVRKLMGLIQSQDKIE